MCDCADLQNAFDRDVAARAITVKTWYHNASDDGIFAYKLLAQTGDPDQPLDRNQVRNFFLSFASSGEK